MIENQDKRIQELTDYYSKKLDDWAKEVIKKEKLARKGEIQKGVKSARRTEELVTEAEEIQKRGEKSFDFYKLDEDSKWLALIIFSTELERLKLIQNQRDMALRKMGKRKNGHPCIYETEECPDRIENFLKLNKELKNKVLDVEEKITIEVNGRLLRFEYKKHSYDKLDYSQMTKEQKWIILMLLSNLENFPFHKFQTTSKFKVKKNILRKSFEDVTKLAYLNYQNKDTVRAPFGKVKKYDYDYLVSKYGERNAEKIRSLPIFPQCGISELENYKLLNNRQKASYCSFRVSHVYKSKRKIASDFLAYANSKGFDIQYVLNPRERSVYYPDKMRMPRRSHYSLDGIDFLRKIIFEWADPCHYYNNGWGKIEDFIRERRIKYFYPSYHYIEINEKKYFPYGKVFGRERYKIFNTIIEDIKSNC